MKGFLQWFKSSTKMKRWMFLILIGIVFACYGISKILVSRELDLNILTIGKIVLAFVMGFSSIVIGIIFINKRNLELIIEATDDRMQDKSNINVNSLIFNKKVFQRGPKIVAIGGGAGLNTVLEGLKEYTNNITAIVAVSDYGKDNEKEKETMQLLPLADIKDSIIALSEQSEEVRKLLNYKFSSGKFAGINFSDVYFSAMMDTNNDFTDSIRKSNKIFNMIGKVLPATLDEMKICAELENGYIVEEKERIPEVVYDKVTSINRIFLNPSNCRPAPGVIEAIKEADSIIIGPGSLYTNVIPCLLVSGVAKAIKESNAIKIYISNIMTEPGQTDNYNLSDHINSLIEHCGEGIIDYCVYDTGEIVPEFIKKYNMQGSDLVDQDIKQVKYKGITYLQRNLSTITDEKIRHNSDLVAASIIEIICDDLKYQDKQNDPQYMMMNAKLKSDKRIERIKKNQKLTNKKEKKARGKSKFSNKYKDRIASIKEADEKFNKAEKKISKKTIIIRDNINQEDIIKNDEEIQINIEKNILGKDTEKIEDNKKEKIKEKTVKNNNQKEEKSKKVLPKTAKRGNYKKNYNNNEDNEENKETNTADQIRREMLEKLQKVKWD